MKFKEDYKQQLAQKIYSEMSKSYQSFDEGASNILYMIRVSLVSESVDVNTPFKDYPTVDGKEETIKQAIREYKDRGCTNLEGVVEKIEDIFFPQVTKSVPFEGPIIGFTTDMKDIIDSGKVYEFSDGAIKEKPAEENKDQSLTEKNKPCCGDPGDCCSKPCGLAYKHSPHAGNSIYLLNSKVLEGRNVGRSHFCYTDPCSLDNPQTPEEKFSFWMKKCAEIEAEEMNAICQDELDELRKQAAEFRRNAWASLNEK